MVVDPALGREIEVRKQGSRTTVVWNPWQEKGSAFDDLAEGEWRELVCVETAAVGGHALVVSAGGTCAVVQHLVVR